jgi:hypothetical protein
VPNTNFVVLLRATQNWSDSASGPFLLTDNPLTRHHEYGDGIDAWNAMYKFTLQEFRAELTQIARATWPTCDVVVWERGWQPDPNTYYLATDDDDWFKPRILKDLAFALPDTPQPLWVWTSQTMLFTDRIARPFFPDSIYVNSNAYLLHGSNPHWEWQLFNHHKLPSRTHWREPLSLYLAHPASLYHRSIVESPLPFIVPREIRYPGELAWASPSITAVHELLIKADSSRYKD